MSYEKVKCITRKPKENKIFITSACNNVRPLTFGKWEYGKADMSYKEKIGRDVEVRAVPRREYNPTNEQIAESKKRVELLGIEPRFSDKLQISDRHYIREVKDVEMDLIRAINNFEKNYREVIDIQ